MVNPARGHSSIGCENFKSGVDDFDEWIEVFERAVKLTTNASGDELRNLYKEWLYLKLDKEAYSILKQCDANLDWNALKAKLKTLLTDPQEKYKWKSKRFTIKWDKVESFQSLAARIVRAVDKYDKDLPEDVRKNEYFFRFREALTKPYQDAIDMGCSENNRTLEDAKDLALRAQMTQIPTEGDGPRALNFAAADMGTLGAMGDDRIAAIERNQASIMTSLETLNSTLRSFGSRLEDLERASGRGRYDRGRSYSRDRDRGRWDRDYSRGRSPRGYSPRYSRDQSRDQGRGNRYGRSPDDRRRYDSSSRGQYHSQSRERSYRDRDQDRNRDRDQDRNRDRDQTRDRDRVRDPNRNQDRNRVQYRSPTPPPPGGRGGDTRSRRRENDQRRESSDDRSRYERDRRYPQNAQGYRHYDEASDTDEERMCAMMDKAHIQPGSSKGN